MTLNLCNNLFRMEIYKVIFALTLVCVVFARKCKTPKPMEHFSLNSFSGSWYEASVDLLDPVDKLKYGNVSCGKFFLHKDNGHNKQDKWEFDKLSGSKDTPREKVDLQGTYYLPNPYKGFIQMFYESGNITYDMTVLGSDYNSFAVVYFCAEISPSYTSEVVLLLLRNLDPIPEIFSDQNIQNWVAQVTATPVAEMQRLSFVGCPQKFF